MTKQEREMIATIGSSLGSAAALLQAAAKEPVKAASESKTVEQPVTVETKEVKVKAECKPPVKRTKGPIGFTDTTERKKDSPHVGGSTGGVRYEWKNNLPINYLTLNKEGRGSNRRDLVFTKDNTLIVEDYVQYKSGDGEVVKYGISLVHQEWHKGCPMSVVVFPVGNSLKGKRYVQEKNAGKLNSGIIEFKAEQLGMLQVMFRGASESNGLLANLGAALS